MATLTIDGYNKDCECQHCGRPLKLGVTTAERGTIGADCFVRLIARNTKRYNGNGKPSAERVKEYAIIAAKGNDYAGRVHGLYGAWNVFELKAA